jgi:hypothetical protein
MENSIIGKWSYNKNEDGYWSNETFDSKEEAIKYGAEFALEEEIETYYVGQFYPVSLNVHIGVDDIIERTAESLDDDFGSEFEHGDQWQGKLPDEKIEELEKMLEETFMAWADKNDLHPTSCTVIEISRHKVEKVA